MKPCDTCGDSYIEKLKDRNSTREQAKKIALEQKKSYAIYQEGDEWKYMEAFAAYALGIRGEVVSGLPGAT